MKADQRRALEAQLNSEIEEASRRLIKNRDAELTEILRRVKTHSRLLALMPRRRPPEWLLAMLVGACCVFLTGILWGVRISETKLILNVQSKAVSMTLADPWSWTGNLALDPNLVRLERLSAINSGLLAPSIESEQGDAWIQLRKAQVAITRFNPKQNVSMRLESAGDGQFSLHSRGAMLAGELSVRGAGELRTGDVLRDTNLQTPLDLAIPETITFESEGMGAVPLRFHGRTAEPWILRELPVRALGLEHEIPGEPGEVSFVSAVIGGQIDLPEISEIVNLREKDRLWLNGVSGRVVELRLENEISLVYQGSAREISLGPPGFARNLAPSYLEYYYNSRPLVFFWTAVVFLWGILWGVRKTIFH